MLKPGDLAIVINASPMHADTIGRIVTVESTPFYLQIAESFCVSVEFVGPIPASVDDGLVSTYIVSDLRKISGPDVFDERETVDEIREGLGA